MLGKIRNKYLIAEFFGYAGFRDYARWALSMGNSQSR
jgi:hypothetical protein